MRKSQVWVWGGTILSFEALRGSGEHQGRHSAQNGHTCQTVLGKVEETPSISVLPDISHAVIPDVSPPILPDVSPPILPDVSPPVIPDVSHPVIPDVLHRESNAGVRGAGGTRRSPTLLQSLHHGAEKKTLDSR